jgi:hypothetical protein
MNLEDVDFRNLDPLETIKKLRSFGKPGLEPLVLWIARGYAYDKANHAVRVSIADGEREAEGLIRQAGSPNPRKVRSAT